MIKKLKKQLYSPQSLVAFFLLAFLLGFFLFAISVQPSFFIYISWILLFITAFLLYFHVQFVKKRAELTLRRQDYLEKANLLEAEITEELRAIQALKKRIVNYSHLKDLTERLSMSFSLEETTKQLSHEVDKLFGSDNITVILYLLHSKKGELGISFSQKGSLKMSLLDKKGDIYDHWVIKNMKPLLVEDAKSDFRFDVNKIEITSSRLIRSLMSVPLLTGNKMIGILRLDSLEENYFPVQDIRLLTTIGDLGAIAIENAQLYEKVEDLAIHDSLTGLFVRRHFLEILGQRIGDPLKKNEDVSFLMIDLDLFKQYNDSHGHTAGDNVLKMVGNILVGMFSGPEDLVCRYGGEEFLVYLKNCSKKRAKELAEEFRGKVEATSVILRRKKTYITTSVGVATSSKDDKDMEALIQKADNALYKAKKRGRNKVCISS